EPAYRGIADLELKRRRGRRPGGDQVLHDLGLRVDRDPPPAGQLAGVQVVALPVELHVDAVVLKPLRVQSVPKPDRTQQLDRGRLKHPGALPRLAVGPAAVLDAHRVDSAEGKQVRKEQARRPRADDSDLRALMHGHVAHPSRIDYITLCSHLAPYRSRTKSNC